MAEILVVQGRGPMNPLRPELWSDDDPVVIFEDGHEWGREELNPAKFRVLKIPSIPPQALEHILEVGDNGRTRRFQVTEDGRFINRDTGQEDRRGRP